MASDKTTRRQQRREAMRCLNFARRWLGLGPVKKAAVFRAVAEALELPYEPGKARGHELCERFWLIFRHKTSSHLEAYKQRKKDRAQKREAFHRDNPTWAAANSDAFLLSFEWRKLRYTVLEKRGARCECCGATPKDGIRIHVDHIKPRRKYPELALSEANLQVLCEVCNHGKGAWDETDWRADSQNVEGEMETPVPRSGDGYGHDLESNGAATKQESRPRLVTRAN